MVLDKKLRVKTTSVIDVMNFNASHSAQTRNDQFSVVSCFKQTSVEQRQTFRLIGLKCPADHILKRVQVFAVNCISGLCNKAVVYCQSKSMLNFSCQVDSAARIYAFGFMKSLKRMN